MFVKMRVVLYRHLYIQRLAVHFIILFLFRCFRENFPRRNISILCFSTVFVIIIHTWSVPLLLLLFFFHFVYLHFQSASCKTRSRIARRVWVSVCVYIYRYDSEYRRAAHTVTQAMSLFDSFGRWCWSVRVCWIPLIYRMTVWKRSNNLLMCSLHTDWINVKHVQCVSLHIDVYLCRSTVLSL